MLFLWLLAGIAALGLIVISPQVGLALFVFSGRYSVARFEAFLGVEGEPTIFNQLRIALLILIILLLAMVIRYATGKAIKKISPRSIISLLLVFIFGLILLTGCWHSPAETYGLEKALEYFVLTQFAFLASILLIDNFKDYKILLGALFLIPLILGLTGIVSALVAGSGGMDRVAAMGGGYIVFGRFMAIGALACLGFILVTKQLRWRGFLIIALILLTAALFYSGSRGVLVAFIPSVIFFVMAVVFSGVVKKKYVRRIITIVVIVFMIGLILFLLYPQLFSSNLERYQYLWRDLPGTETISLRLQNWGSALNMFIQQPLIGYGTGAFAPVALGVLGRDYPHNIFLEIAAETGIVGLLVFISFIFVILCSITYILRARESHPGFHIFSIVVATCFIFYFLAAQFSGDLYDSRFIWFFGGIILALENMVMREKRALSSVTAEKVVRQR